MLLLLRDFSCTHPLGVKVLFDLEAVHDARGGQAAFHAGQEEQQQGHLGVFHPRTQTPASGTENGTVQTRAVHLRSEDDLTERVK